MRKVARLRKQNWMWVPKGSATCGTLSKLFLSFVYCGLFSFTHYSYVSQKHVHFPGHFWYHWLRDMTYPSWKQILIPSILILILSIIIIFPNGLVKLIPSCGQLDSKSPVEKEVVVKEVVEAKQQSQQKPQRHKQANGHNQETFLSSLKSKVLNDIIPITPDHLNISSIDCYNNVHLSPRLQSIIHMDYFRFVKINLKKPCSLWPDDTKCSER